MASGEKSEICASDKVGGRLERGRLERGALARLEAELQECEAPTDKCSWRGGAG